MMTRTQGLENVTQNMQFDNDADYDAHEKY